MTEPLEPWRAAFRAAEGLLSTEGLQALRRALAEDDPRLVQGQTTQPPPLLVVQDWPVEGACALTFTGWVGDGLKTVAECEEFFARTCFGIDQRVGEPAGCRWFLNAYDEWPRQEMIRNLLPEVERALAARGKVEAV